MSAETNKLFCPKCGRELPSGSEFCPYCGAKLERPRAAAAPAQAKGRALPKMPPLRIVAPVAAVLVVALGAFLVWQAFFSPRLPAACYYSLSKVEVYDGDGNLESVTEHTLSDQGLRTKSVTTTYDEDGEVEDETTTYYDTNEDYGIYIAVEDEGDSAEIEVKDEDEFGQPTEYTCLNGVNGEANSTTLTYHGEGMLKGELNEIASEYCFESSTEYDEEGWPSSFENSMGGMYVFGREYEYERNDQGRVTKYRAIDEDGEEVFDRTISYGSNGMVESYVDENGTKYQFTYQRISDPAPLVAAQNHSFRYV